MIRAPTAQFGGLNDVLWRLYMRSGAAADADADGPEAAADDVGGGRGWWGGEGGGGALRLRTTASLFDRPCLLGPLAAGQDTLAHMHANTQLPVLAGANARFEATGDVRFRRLAAFFVELLLRTRTFATGGSSVGEYWVDAHRLGELVAPGEGTTQESCSTHNMMRLARGLLLTSVPAEIEQYASYHERALFNSVLGTQRGDKPGEMLYWLPLGAGVSKMDLKHPTHGDGQQHGWSHPHGDFWCCVGSGLESFARLSDSTFFRQAGGAAPPVLYVLQLVSSTLAWDEAGVRAALEVDEPGSLPADQPLRLRLALSPLAEAREAGVGGGAGAVGCTVRLRLPRWAWGDGAPPVATLDGAPLPTGALASAAGSLLEVTREWRSGGALAVELPMTLRAERLSDSRPRYAALHARTAG